MAAGGLGDPGAAAFRRRLLAGETLAGTFVKTPSPILCEVLGLTALDAVCLDLEHAPFGRVELDGCIAALRAARMPALARLAANRPEYVLQALDCGAAGVVVPHVSNPEQAAAAAAAARFSTGRGYAGSTRSARFTTRTMAENLATGDAETTLMVQVEDRAAVAAVAEISAVEGVDCLFIGKNDLTVSLGADSSGHETVQQAIDKVCRAGADAGTPVGLFVDGAQEARQWRDRGVSFFLSSSDHGFLLQGAAQLAAALRPD